MTSPAIPGYTFENCYGSGAFGTVWKARWNDEFECAVKVLHPGAWHPHYLSWCLERLRRDPEPAGLVRIFSFDVTGDAPHLSMALMPEGTLTLEQLAGRLPALEAWVLLDSLAATLAWLHGEGIVHTGLSTGNVFVSAAPAGEPSVLVSDTGQGWLTEAPVARLHGQMGFIAPEHWRTATQLLQEGRAQPRDVYAFGVIAWRLLTGAWPRGGQVFDAIMAARNEDLHLQGAAFADWLEKEAPAEWPAPAESERETARRRLVERCLALDPAERFAGMPEVLAALRENPLMPVAAAENEAPPEQVEAAAEDAGDAEEGITADTADTATTTEEAFDESENKAPRRRRFSLRLPRLSARLQEQREEEIRPRGRGLVAPVLASAAILAAAGTGAWAFKEREARITASNDLSAARRANESLSQRLPRAEADAANFRSEATAARAERDAADRHQAVDVAAKVLATQPLEEEQWPDWRTAVHAVAEYCTPVLENAPADAQGMNARWYLARLRSALGDDAAALPVLEKLTRDLESAALQAGGDVPAELSRLSGRVESLKGKILTAQGRTENALEALRKASAALGKWLEENAGDTETARLAAQNLLLEGLALMERDQLDEAQNALMKIAGLTGKSDDPSLKPEDRFLLADAQCALGRLDARKAAAVPASEEGAEETRGRLLETAINQHMDAVTMLLAYDDANKKSVQCRTRLAKGYYDMGCFLVLRGNWRDASVALGQSMETYTELLADQPGTGTYIMSLAKVYNEISKLYQITKPGAAGAREALEYQNASVDSMKILDETSPLDNDIRRLLAASLVLNGELLQEAGETGPALKRFTEAITVTSELLGQNSLAEGERREVRRCSARARTGAARLHERAGRPDAAVAALTEAMADWEQSPVENPSDEKLMGWVKEKLEKLKR